MNSSEVKLASGRAFVRSLNILLKYARLYGFGHTRTAAQFETAWQELHDALPATNDSGLLLSASGTQLLLDGAPVEATPAERSFAQLLSAAGLASIQFTSSVSKDDLATLVQACPSQSTKPSVLAEQLKTALAHTPAIRINEVRFIPEDASKVDALSGLLTAKSLGADAESMKDWLRDPQRLLALIAAAEGSRSDSATSSGLEGAGNAEGDAHWSEGPGSGESAGGRTSATADEQGGMPSSSGTALGRNSYSGAQPSDGLLVRGAEPVQTQPASGGVQSDASTSHAPGLRASTRAGPASPASRTSPAAAGTARSGNPKDSGSRFLPWSGKDEDILGVLKLLTRLGGLTDSEAGRGAGPLQEQLAKLPADSQETLRQALAAVAAHTPARSSSEPLLLRLAEHLAIRFALDRYERGDVKVDAIRQMIERMSQEIEALRKILGSHEQKLADAGVIVESSADLLDRQFWTAVPERGKRTVLLSNDAWCIPPRNVKQYVEELLKRGDEATAFAVLETYALCVQSTDPAARRRTAIGLADLADLYGEMQGRPLLPAIRATGAQLSSEREDDLQGLISAAFVRLTQEAGSKRAFTAIMQALDSLDAVENQRPLFAQNLRPRLGLEKRIPEFLEDVLRGNRVLEGLQGLLQRMPRTTSENLVSRFNRASSPAEMQHVVDLAEAGGSEITGALRDMLRSGSAAEAAETTGLLSRLDLPTLERWLPDRLGDWPRQAQDRAVRLAAAGRAPERGRFLLSLLSLLDPVLRPLAVDEVGLSGELECAPILLRLAEGASDRPQGPFLRLKAIEALGRLKAPEAAELLRRIIEERHMFQWTHPLELRLAALQALAKIDSNTAHDVLNRSGLIDNELSIVPLDPLPGSDHCRQRRYQRFRLKEPIPALATVGTDSYRLTVRSLSLSGGIALGDKHLQPGTLVSLRIGTGLRPIRAQVLMRDARAQGLGFEIAEMDLDERARLRRLLLTNASGTALPTPATAHVSAS